MRPQLGRAGVLIACIIIALCAHLETAQAGATFGDGVCLWNIYQPPPFDPGGDDDSPSIDGADTIHKGMSLLFISTIDADCYPDSVWGDRVGSLNASSYLPKVIVWGRYDESGQRGRNDSTERCKGHIPGKSRVPYTLITYPDWRNLHGSLTTIRFNVEDTLSDMLIAIKGTATDGQRQHDTSRVILIWGQSSLCTLHTLALADIEEVQIEPFAAMELRKGADVSSEKHRDGTGRNSYEVRREGFREHDKKDDTTRPLHSPAAGVLRVYPNPTGIAAQVEGRSIPAGSYNVEIVAVNGEVSEHREVTVKESGSLFETLDVTGLPTGYYLVRLEQHGKPLGIYPIVVTH